MDHLCSSIAVHGLKAYPKKNMLTPATETMAPMTTFQVIRSWKSQ